MRLYYISGDSRLKSHEHILREPLTVSVARFENGATYTGEWVGQMAWPGQGYRFVCAEPSDFGGWMIPSGNLRWILNMAH